MLELSESYHNDSKIEENVERFPDWDFDRSHDGVRGRNPYRCSFLLQIRERVQQTRKSPSYQ